MRLCAVHSTLRKVEVLGSLKCAGSQTTCCRSFAMICSVTSLLISQCTHCLIFRMIRSAHCIAGATMDSVRGLLVVEEVVGALQIPGEN
jgi:hypothetical protein